MHLHNTPRCRDNRWRSLRYVVPTFFCRSYTTSTIGNIEMPLLVHTIDFLTLFLVLFILFVCLVSTIFNDDIGNRRIHSETLECNAKVSQWSGKFFVAAWIDDGRRRRRLRTLSICGKKCRLSFLQHG